MGQQWWLCRGHGGTASVSPTPQHSRGLGGSWWLRQGWLFGVRFPFSIRVGFGGSSLRLSRILGVRPRRAVLAGFPYQPVTEVTWL